MLVTPFVSACSPYLYLSSSLFFGRSTFVFQRFPPRSLSLFFLFFLFYPLLLFSSLDVSTTFPFSPRDHDHYVLILPFTRDPCQKPVNTFSLSSTRISAFIGKLAVDSLLESASKDFPTNLCYEIPASRGTYRPTKDILGLSSRSRSSRSCSSIKAAATCTHSAISFDMWDFFAREINSRWDNRFTCRSILGLTVFRVFYSPLCRIFLSVCVNSFNHR